MAPQITPMPTSELITQSMADVEPKLRTSATQTSATRSPGSDQSIVPAALSTRETSSLRTDTSIEEYKMFITLVFGVSIFGASTFAVAIGQMTDPADIWKPKTPPFAIETVRTFLGAAWLCFVLSIAVAGFSSSFLALLKSQGGGNEDNGREKKWEGIAIFASTLLWPLLVVAFLFLSLAMVPYAYVPGWIAVASTILYGIGTTCLMFLQIRQVSYDSEFYGGSILTIKQNALERSSDQANRRFGNHSNIMLLKKY